MVEVEVTTMNAPRCTVTGCRNDAVEGTQYCNGHSIKPKPGRPNKYCVDISYVIDKGSHHTDHNQLIQELAAYDGYIPDEELKFLIKRYEHLIKQKYLKYYCGFKEDVMPYTNNKGKKVKQEVSNKGMTPDNYKEYMDMCAIIKKLKKAQSSMKEVHRQDKYAYNIARMVEGVHKDGYVEPDDDADKWVVDEFERGFDEVGYGTDDIGEEDPDIYGEKDDDDDDK
jgi:hypothetical protein